MSAHGLGNYQRVDNSICSDTPASASFDVIDLTKHEHADKRVAKPCLVVGSDTASCEAPSDSSWDRCTQGLPSLWRQGWKTHACIIGFYVFSAFCAILHLIVFNYLDGRLIVKNGSAYGSNINNETLPFLTTTVPQTYATTASLALVTAFRAAMVACVGLCYTQQLWHRLRGTLLQVATIEELFQIRANILRLLKPSVLRHAPVLFSLAVVSWMLPVAMIYPPGALVVGLENRAIPTHFNVSGVPAEGIIQPASPSDTQSNNTFTKWCSVGLAQFTIDYNRNVAGLDYCNEANAKTQLDFGGSTSELDFIAKSVLVQSRIFELDPLSQLNAQYTMRFRGPMLRCTDHNKTKITPVRNLRVDPIMKGLGRLFKGGPTPPAVGGSFIGDRNESGEPSYTFSVTAGLGSVTVENSSNPTDWMVAPCLTGATPLVNITDGYVVQTIATKRCVAVSTEYSLAVSFTNGLQHVEYTTGPTQDMPLEITFDQGKIESAPFQSWQDYFQALALVDSLVRALEVRWQKNPAFEIDPADPAQNVSMPDNTTTEACQVLLGKPVADSQVPPVLLLSSFNRDRESPRWDRISPNTGLDMTEKRLNEALANITISALTLKKAYSMVNGSYNGTFNVYHFENRLSFYLPYGLSLLFTLPILIIGLLALHRNGVTAIDGGFLQILVTTTGRTSLEAAAAKGCMGGEEHMSRELKRLKVRFGELIDVEHGALEHFNSGNKLLATNHNDHDEDVRNVSSEGSRGMRSSVAESSETSGVDIDKPGKYVPVRRAGFGLLSETIPLERGVRYGSS